ncbi:MAG TPA: sensor histidine kinase [Gemmatimonadaceae bacterium]
MPAGRARELWSKVSGFVLAVVFVGGATALALLMRPILPIAPFLGAVLAAAWLGGAPAGVLALVLSVPSLVYLVVPSFDYSERATGARMMAFSVASVALIWSSARVRASERALRAANVEIQRLAHEKLQRSERRARRRVVRARFQAKLDERTRLAREIHDTLLQGFTGVSLQLVAAQRREEMSPECRSLLGNLVAVSQKTIEDARKAVWDMRPPSLRGKDFAEFLRESITDIAAASNLAVEFRALGRGYALNPDVETAIYRVAQAASSNVVQHAEANTLRVVLTFAKRGVILTVADDGRGFVVDPGLHNYAGRWGLLGMRERASQLGGGLSITSVPGQGTQVMLRLPRRTRMVSAAATDRIERQDRVVASSATSTDVM